MSIYNNKKVASSTGGIVSLGMFIETDSGLEGVENERGVAEVN